MPRTTRTERTDTGRSRSLWSGTITFGLVSIPVDLYSAVRGRNTTMRLVDPKGRALGRQYYCPKDERTLSNADLVRGFEADNGKMLAITDEELDAVAPEMTRDIALQRFVPREQIPPGYYQRPYFLAPSGRSSKAYHLLADTMAGSGQAAIGSFVMRGHQYLAAILSEGGLLRLATLRRPDELRSPAEVGLPKAGKKAASGARAVEKAIDALTREALDMDELSDRYADALMQLVESKKKKGTDVVHTGTAAPAEGEPAGADVIDLMKVLRERVSPKATVTTAGGEAPSKDNVRHLPARKKPARVAGRRGRKRRRA